MSATLKNTLKFAWLGISVLWIATLAYLLVAGVLSLVPTDPEPHECAEREPVFILTNGVHLFLLIPRDKLGPSLREGLSMPSHAEYVLFGWGERDFYINTPTWKQLKPGLALKALFLPTDPAMHVDYSRTPRGHPVDLCPEQMDRLTGYIAESFERDREGKFIRIDHPGFGPYDAFYAARGTYSLARTCNNWVNQALKRADVKTSLWSPFDGGVLYHLK